MIKSNLYLNLSILMVFKQGGGTLMRPILFVISILTFALVTILPMENQLSQAAIDDTPAVTDIHPEGDPGKVANNTAGIPDKNFSKVNDSAITAKPFATPSETNTIGINGVWLFKAGISYQSPADTYVNLNKHHTLISQIIRNNVLISQTTFNWYRSTDGKNWKPVSIKDSSEGITQGIETTSPAKNRDQSDLTVSSKKEQTVYYQVQAQVYPIDFNPILTSRVFAVHFVDQDIPSTDFSIKTNTDYLISDNHYKDGKFIASIKFDPSYSTDNNYISWSVSDNNLAKIDSNGIFDIKDEAIGKSGSFDIIATLNRNDNKPIQVRKKTIKILHLIDGDTDVIAGQTAHFKLNDSFSDDSSLYWWATTKSKSKSKYLKIEPEGPAPNLNHTAATVKISNISIDDNLSTIGITIFTPKLDNPNGKKPIKQDKNKETPLDMIIAQRVTLHVHEKPVFTTTNKISDIDYSRANETVSKLTDVIPTDHLIHDISLSNSSDFENYSTKPGTFIFPYSPNESIKSVKVGQKDVNYTLDADKHQLEVPNLTVSVKGTTKIEITAQVNSFVTGHFDYDPVLKLSDGTEVKIKQTSATFSSNSIELSELKPIDFGSVLKFGPRTHQRKSPDETSPIVTINDRRRNKAPASLQLESSDIYGPNGEASHMRFNYIDEHHQKSDPMNHSVEVANSSNGKKFPSIVWKKYQGLNLVVPAEGFPDGHYKANLTWCISNSI